MTGLEPLLKPSVWIEYISLDNSISLEFLQQNWLDHMVIYNPLMLYR